MPSDPKRPVTSLVQFPASPQDDYVDWMNMFSLMCGIMGLFLRSKIMAWSSVLACLASLANMKTADLEVRQIMSSFSISLMGLVMAYFSPNSKFYQ